ncbi:UNKNOWN [Stylonychia lemnae]|uniref:Uncharacterized protein n=1 Tax=Stylonychia lemnae TaxID=5949 RepID=A0A078AK75_STYLE|nr:UNKNOWN [Stylonychia lemnae]|eukprot:CDW82296.1 UNKNOWN [Stylonychia lemnae]
MIRGQIMLISFLFQQTKNCMCLFFQQGVENNILCKSKIGYQMKYMIWYLHMMGKLLFLEVTD